MYVHQWRQLNRQGGISAAKVFVDFNLATSVGFWNTWQATLINQM